MDDSFEYDWYIVDTMGWFYIFTYIYTYLYTVLMEDLFYYPLYRVDILINFKLALSPLSLNNLRLWYTWCHHTHQPSWEVLEPTLDKTMTPFNLAMQHTHGFIALGIRKKHMIRPNRRSKGGMKLFHHIHMITVTKSYPTSEDLPDCNWVHHEHLVTSKINNNRRISAMFSHINARSIYPKVLTFQQHVSMVSSTLCATTETWLPNEKEDEKYKEVPPPGNKILSQPT